MADYVGRQLGSYRLVRLLGKGSFAAVYLGEHTRLGTQVAIKVHHSELPSDALERFHSEAHTIAHFRHPHIVYMLEFGIQDSFPFLVMDYVPNGTLRQHHPRGTPLALSTVETYVQQLAAALQYVHDKGLIHCDLKPENILLGAHHELLLTDFGLAALTHTTSSLLPHQPMGTLTYMAPEQFLGQPRPASDQYALGILVYEWLCGDPPFQGADWRELAFQHIYALPAPLRAKAPAIPPALEEVVLIALAKDPKKRFASVRAFARAFEQARQ